MKKEIGTNVSSGAEKVEKTARQQPKQPAKKKSTSSSKAVKVEHAAANKRVAAAKSRADKKQEKAKRRADIKREKLENRAKIRQRQLEKRQQIAEKKLERKELLARKKAERIEKRQQRRADLKERRVEKRAERTARKEMLRNESKAERQKRIAREKKERLALKVKRREAKERERERKIKAREAARVRRAEDRKHRREQKTERRKHAPGFGGWLAAVISLGVACLALGTVVTAESIRMNDMQVSAESGYRTNLYEMVAASEDMDDSLAKLRISSGNSQKQLLTNLLVDAALMESALEKIPVDAVTGTDISGFVNRTATLSRELLSKVSAGGTLTGEERHSLSALHETNETLYRELNELITHLDAGQLRTFVNGKGGEVGEKLSGMGKAIGELEEAPFIDEGNVGKNRLAAMEEISSAEAQQRAMELFGAYHVREASYTGETVAREISCYNFTLSTEDGLEIFAQISKNGGKLVFFDTYEECATKNFDLATCDAIAREYLATLGIDEAEAVWLSDGGMIANLTYTAVEDGVRLYPEILRVRVCEEKGRVVGLDASGYLLNHRDRSLTASLTKKEAEAHLSDSLEIVSSNLALIPVGEEEVLTYEFSCKYGEEEYLVYLDAASGEEVQLFRVRESAQGSYLR